MEHLRHKKRIKVCFVLPETAAETATHFLHKYELMRELEHKVEFFVYQPTLAGIAKMKIVYFLKGCRIFYVHYSFKGALAAIFLTRLFGGRVYYWNCGLPWQYRRGWLEERIFRFILHATLFVTGTKELAAEYSARYAIDSSCVRVVPNYIDVRRMQNIDKQTARTKLALPADKKIVLFLHRLSKRKGADRLPEIMRAFADSRDVLFLIVGDGPEKKNLEQAFGTSGGKMVQLRRSVPNIAVPLYMAAADIYLMPSEEEGMPNVLLEAMAAGVPFVAAGVGGVKGMVPPELHEYVLPYGETALFAETTKKLLVSKELREQISRGEQEWVRRYDVARIAPEFLRLIQE